jgi:SPX domain protein involved in polyphosphate accumulation
LPLTDFNALTDLLLVADPLLSSVYLDNESMVMYGPRLRREDGATLIRLRVYGDDHPSMHGACFVERKTHCEKIYGGTSKKERWVLM